MKPLLLSLLLCSGCAFQAYHNKGGVSYIGVSILMNDQVSKLAVDRTSPKTGYHQGIGISGLGLDVDDAAITAISEGVTKGVLKGMGVP